MKKTINLSAAAWRMHECGCVSWHEAHVPGSVYADPIITVYGSGEITLMVNQTIIELSEITKA